jgi:hypothetical protein
MKLWFRAVPFPFMAGLSPAIHETLPGLSGGSWMPGPRPGTNGFNSKLKV